MREGYVQLLPHACGAALSGSCCQEVPDGWSLNRGFLQVCHKSRTLSAVHTLVLCLRLSSCCQDSVAVSTLLLPACCCCQDAVAVKTHIHWCSQWPSNTTLMMQICARQLAPHTPALRSQVTRC